jgi:hypothetical protein
MWLSRVFQSLKVREFRLAWAVALAADGIQILLLPLFLEGGFSPVDGLVDLCAAFVLSRLLGWHWAFLPTLFAELVPGLDLFPTWTAAVAYVTVQHSRSNEADIPVQPVQRWSTRRSLNS